MKWNVRELCAFPLEPWKFIAHRGVDWSSLWRVAPCSERKITSWKTQHSQRQRVRGKLDQIAVAEGGIFVKHKSLLEKLPVPWRNSHPWVKHMTCTWENQTVIFFFLMKMKILLYLVEGLSENSLKINSSWSQTRFFLERCTDPHISISKHQPITLCDQIATETFLRPLHLYTVLHYEYLLN